MPRINKSKIVKRRAELNRLHKIYSWRKMAHEIYDDEITFQVLARFATDKSYIPADENILHVLDIVHVQSPYRILPKWYKRIPEALRFFNSKREQIKMMTSKTRESLKG